MESQAHEDKVGIVQYRSQTHLDQSGVGEEAGPMSRIYRGP
jgi:hypothetical protein